MNKNSNQTVIHKSAPGLAVETLKAFKQAKAAFLINGETIHSLFNIPVENQKRANFLQLQDKELGDLQKKFEKTNHLVIDEFSMLGQEMIGKIDRRAKQAKNNNLIFGGMSIILIGDPAQLLPVGQSTLYDTELSSDLAKTGYIAYQKFKTVITLEAVMRQQNLENDQNQAKFLELLPRLRDGSSTVEDWKLLCQRSTNVAPLAGFENSICIFNDNDSVDEKNFDKLTSLKHVTELRAINSDTKAQQAKPELFNNLVNSLHIANGCSVTLISNTWKKMGLVNGAFGIVKDIIYPILKTKDTLPDTVIVHFEKYIGPQFFAEETKKNWIPLVAKPLYSPIVKSTRKQYALRLAYAITT
jgi:ATP-dependent exoDNAse (exonuclease V) alpha subunit